MDQRANILIVDDEQVNRHFLSTLLGYAGHRTLEAGDAANALTLARRQPPDLIIADLLMPGVDGYETCRQVRQLPGLGKTVTAAVSGCGREEVRRKSQEAGFDRRLAKPIGRAVPKELVKSAAAKE